MCRRSCITSTALSLNKENAMSTPLQPSGTWTIKPPISLDLPPNRTVDFKRQKTIKVKTTGAEKSYMTVVLSCLAVGTKIPTMIVFKRKTMPKKSLLQAYWSMSKKRLDDRGPMRRLAKAFRKTACLSGKCSGVIYLRHTNER